MKETLTSNEFGTNDIAALHGDALVRGSGPATLRVQEERLRLSPLLT